MIVIKAVIMAGGKGTRLRPLTCGIPKPMVPIFNKPVMEYSIELLKKYNIDDIAVTMAYLPSVITDYFGSGKEWKVKLNYFIEEIPLGTGGSVKNAEEFLDDTFIVISGDALTDINIKKAVQFHRDKKSKATLILKKVSVPLEYGVVITDETGKVIRFLEKPSWGEVFSDTVNTGIYILEPEVLDDYKKGDNFDFSKDLFPKLLKEQVPMYGYIMEDYWNDIGDLNSYMKTQFDILEGKVKVKLNCDEVQKGIWIDEGTKIGENVKLYPPVYIGKNTIVGDAVGIHPYTIIGENCEIGKEATLKRSILWKNIKIGGNTHLSGTTVCSNTQIKNGVNIYENSAVGSGTLLSKGVIVKPNIKIWPDKKIEEDTIVSQNLVWGTKQRKTIFGYKDVSGNINIDITPEFASRLGSAFASNLEKEATIIVSSDKSNACDIIKNSFISGILSTGAGVINLKDASMPMNRFAVRHYDADGGIHIRLDPYEKDLAHIEFVDENGANIDRNMERKIENLLNRDDFKRCSVENIKSVMHVDNFSSLYMKNGIKLMSDISKIKRCNPKVMISSTCKNVLNLSESFFQSMGCQVQCEYDLYKYKSLDEYIADFSSKIQKNTENIGMILSSNGENMILIDEKGRIIDKEMYTLLVTNILLKLGISKEIIVPYTAPKVIDKMVSSFQGKVIRTKTAPSYIMKEMLKNDYEENMYLQYILNYDAILAAGKIIDFLISRDCSLSDLVDELPDFYLIKKEIACDWQDKGRVIKEMIINHKGTNMELFEGIKINNDKGWALILPDSERAVFNVYTEGLSEEYAKELSTQFSQKVENILNNN
ncbi:sugar phosphate nucleotidyltransferase [Crassaminicella indica]|uniref:NTP transferase domain-containing protein n=1 Tax=Crassaminicella indica TaxID=2855394 RepID=A0ABX8R8H9_9CLOT|nr:sugar phosphate nucleotidyltransferase [Crassaminicella indica]QXM05337.1 NTP transferase domain-containing protein [Crassaminicella indica]